MVSPGTKTCCPCSYLIPGFTTLILLTTPVFTSNVISSPDPYPLIFEGKTLYVLSGIAEASPELKETCCTKPEMFRLASPPTIDENSPSVMLLQPPPLNV